MCGILGYIHHQNPISQTAFSKMLTSLADRGPDGEDKVFLNQGRAALGQRRLSIIDLSSAGSQPMANEDGNIWLTVNGEIYNYKKLRQDLEKNGHRFHSNSDSEVIVHAYEEWGTRCVNYLDGIFAFGIFDGRDGSLFIARDHFGIKPIYYYFASNRFIFASQPKAILAADDFTVEMDQASFQLYLGYGNVPAEHSIYKGVKKLLPGHSLRLLDRKITIEQYWKLDYNPVIHNISEAIDIVREKVISGIFAQTVSDVPVGTLLSGGVDSTIVTSSLVTHSGLKLPTFSVGFQEVESDERQYARLVADTLKTDHHEYLLTYAEACRIIPKIVDAYDEPFHFNGLFPYYALSRFVKEYQIKVVLGGDGSDEIFAGYLWYENFIKDYKLRPSYMGQIGQDATAENLNPIKSYFGYNGSFHPSEQKNILGADVAKQEDAFLYDILGRHWNKKLPPVLAAQLLDVNCFLVDHCLTKVDRASMACGVEVRVPFLDIELAKTVFSIDHELVFSNNERKSLLKKAMHDALPQKMNTNRKKGFSSPVSKWLDQGLAKTGHSLLLNGSLCKNGLLNGTYLKENFFSLTAGNQMLLIAAELWFERWINHNTDKVEAYSLQAASSL